MFSTDVRARSQQSALSRNRRVKKKYRIEVGALHRAFQRLLKLQRLDADGVVFHTNLLLVAKRLQQLARWAIEPHDARLVEVQNFVASSATQSALVVARACIGEITKTRDHAGIRAANQQVSKFRKRMAAGKHTGCGYGSLHRKVGGGATESARRRH